MAPSVGPTHGVQANANAAPATSGPPEPARLDQHVGPPVAVQPWHQRGEHEQHAERDDDPPPRRCPACRAESWSVEPRPVAVIPSATNTTREREAERQRGEHHVGALAALELARVTPGDRRQVARDERQHAGRDEGHEADREGCDDRRVDAAAHRRLVRRPARRRAGARRPSPAARRPSGPGPACAAPAPRGDGHPGDARATRAGPGRGRRRGRSRSTAGRRACRARTPSTSASLTSCLSLPSAIWRRMKARSWSATAEAETLRAVRIPRTSPRPRCPAATPAGPRRVAKRSNAAASTSASRLLPQQPRQRLVERRLVDRPAALGGYSSPSLDHERLGEGARPVAVGELPVPVTEARVGEVEAAHELQRRGGDVLVVGAQDGARSRAAIDLCVFSSSGSSSVHGLHQEAQKFRTTTLPL